MSMRDLDDGEVGFTRRGAELPNRVRLYISGRVQLAGVLALLSVAVAWPALAQEVEAEPDRTAAVSETASVVAQFTTGVEDREPIDQVTFVENTVDKVYFFSDLRGFAGQTVTHRWVYSGETKAEVPFEVRGPRWRVWSSKSLLPDWIGDWTVEVLDAAGEVVAAETFTYTAPDA